MALLPQDRQSQVMLLITMGMVALGYFFWSYWEQPTSQQIAAVQAEADSLQAIIDKAKQALASGTVEDLRRKVEAYRALLGVMRRLVPDKNEVPALIDDISTKAKVRGVTIGRIEPLPAGDPRALRPTGGVLVRYRKPAAHHRAAGPEPESGAAAGPAVPERHPGRAARGAILHPDVRQVGRAAPGAGGAKGEGRGGGPRMSARLTSVVVAFLVAGPLAAQAKPQPARPDSARADTAPLRLVREVFSYEGGGRDPFLSLLKSGDIRPLLSDLKLVGIYYDGRYPARSVAVLRDVTNNKVYRAKPGDILGRLKVTTIRPREIVFTVQEFGFERQESLQLAKQEVTP